MTVHLMWLDSALFRGKVLSSSDQLEDIGINAGEVLKVAKGRRAAVKPAPAKASSVDTTSAKKSSNNLGDNLDLKKKSPKTS
eukprot:gene7493-5385_t